MEVFFLFLLIFIMIIALGSGFPLGACLATNEASKGMVQGKHGSTYGGNPLAVSVGREVLAIISNKKFLKNVDSISRYLWKNLKKLAIGW